MRTILLGISLAVLNAAASYFGAMGFYALEIPSLPYQFLFLTAVLYFVGARYIGTNIFYPAFIAHIVLSLFAVYVFANNSFMVPKEFSQSFLETLIQRYPSLLFEFFIVIAALLFGVLSKKYLKSK